MTESLTEWLTPAWPAPPHVKAICTTRQGGVSEAPWDALNLGDHVGDSPEHVALNRAVLQRHLSEHGEVKPVFLRQVHGTRVCELNGASDASGAEADAALTRERGLACTMMVADCLPVLLTDTQGRVVAAAHAGWRGLAGHDGVGVLETTLHAMRAGAAGDIMAWLGPCIGPGAFEVGDEVRAAFTASAEGAAPYFAPASASGKWLADLAGLARHRLTAAGVSMLYGNDSTPDWCTVTQSGRFFSHRRDAGRLGSTGRFAAAVWLV